jgi:hypothetical protein
MVGTPLVSRGAPDNLAGETTTLLCLGQPVVSVPVYRLHDNKKK